MDQAKKELKMKRRMPTDKNGNAIKNFKRPHENAMPMNIKLWAKVTGMASEIWPNYPDGNSIIWAEKKYKSQGGTWK